LESLKSTTWKFREFSSCCCHVVTTIVAMALLGPWRATKFSSSFCTQLAGQQNAATERVGRPVSNLIVACESIGKIGQKLRTRVHRNNAARIVQGQKSVPPQDALGRRLPSLHRAASGAEAQTYTLENEKTSEGFQTGDGNSSKQGNREAGDVRAVHIKPTPLTQENFAPFGQVCGAMSDGAEFGGEDAQLELDGGVPRYVKLKQEWLEALTLELPMYSKGG
jgi:hypothetical protein